MSTSKRKKSICIFTQCSDQPLSTSHTSNVTYIGLCILKIKLLCVSLSACELTCMTLLLGATYFMQSSGSQEVACTNNKDRVVGQLFGHFRNTTLRVPTTIVATGAFASNNAIPCCQVTLSDCHCFAALPAAIRNGPSSQLLS